MQYLIATFGHASRVGPVENMLSIAVGNDQIDPAQNSQVVRDGRLGRRELFAQLIYAHLPLLQQDQDMLASLIGHSRETVSEVTTGHSLHHLTHRRRFNRHYID